jgi:hypothetical protein
MGAESLTTGKTTSARMYKTRFHKWGLQKTLKFGQVGEMLRQNAGRAASGKQAIRLLNGKQIDNRRLKKYIRSLSAEKHSELTQIALGHGARDGLVSALVGTDTNKNRQSCRTPSPGSPISHLFHLPAPDAVRVPEESIFVMQQYVAGAVDSGQWALDTREVLRAGPYFPFWNMSRTAKGLLVGGETRQAFRVLNNIFHDYRKLVQTQSPQLYLYTYLVAAIFADGYPALFVSFLRYAANLAGIVYFETHPLAVLLTQLSRMGPEAARDNIVGLTRAYVSFCGRGDPGSIAMLDTEAQVTMQLCDLNIHSNEVAEADLRGLIARLAPHTDIEINNAITFDLRDDLAVNLMRQKRFDEAHELLIETLASPVLSKFPLLYASCLRNLFMFSRDQCHNEEARRAGHQLVKFAHDKWGLGDNKTLRVMSEFKDYLRKVGESQMADSLDQDFDTAMDELSQGIEDFQLSI